MKFKLNPYPDKRAPNALASWCMWQWNVATWAHIGYHPTTVAGVGRTLQAVERGEDNILRVDSDFTVGP